ncbi:hypothetical protein [Spirulina sp. 06S082]|uniref:hypothetical protein n=1 Tax=Spirulina sp. 06S082 TaxID=3110248 RepID=UPI002B21427F|nr:hypothetical protein [Spirulina sp. 06S082]MEA5470386.1 hypothetical protein [Spirulina sp. 06S082]
MSNNQTQTYKPLPVLHPLGRSVLIVSTILFIIGGILLHNYDKLQKQCDYQKNVKRDKPEVSIPIYCDWIYLLSSLGSTLIQSPVVILLIELSLMRESKRETQKNMEKLTDSISTKIKEDIKIGTQDIKENTEKSTKVIVEKIQNSMKAVFNSPEVTQHIQVFYQTKDEYINLISDDFKKSEKSEIKILGLFEEIKIFDVSKRFIKQKVIDGCNVKILMANPESKLIQCLTESNSLYYSKEVVDYRFKVLESLCKEISEKQSEVKGSLELKLHTLFSPCCYYSNKEMKVISMYLNDSEDHDFPAFKLANSDFIEDIEKHFKYLWNNGKTILKISTNSENNITDL